MEVEFRSIKVKAEAKKNNTNALTLKEEMKLEEDKQNEAGSAVLA
jgi:hypothetical protein